MKEIKKGEAAYVPLLKFHTFKSREEQERILYRNFVNVGMEVKEMIKDVLNKREDSDMRELKNACNDSVIIADVSAFPIYCENLIVQNQLLAALHKRREIRCFLYNGYIYQSPFFCIIPASSVLEINSRTCFSDSISANISLRTARLIQPFLRKQQ